MVTKHLPVDCITKSAQREAYNAARFRLTQTTCPPVLARALRDLGQGDDFPSLMCAIEIFQGIGQAVSRQEVGR